MTLPDTLTLTGLEQFVNGIIQNLQNAGTTLEGNGSIVIGGATSQISSLLNQLKQDIGENFTKPINQLTQQIQNMATQILSVSTRLDDILKNQQACLLINAQVFLAGVQSITSGLKNGLPIISKDSPRIDYFQFVGYTPGIIPKAGGQVVIHGFDLWENSKYPPQVTIYAQDQKTLIKKITPQKGQDVNSFSFVLDAAFIQANQGKNLQLQIIPKEKKWLDLFGPKVLGSFFMPMVIPNIVFAKFQVKAYLQYESDQVVEKILDYRRFGMGNSSCEDRKNYSHSESWPLPEGGQIISYVSKDADTVNQMNIGVSIAGNTITAAGWLDTATCVNVFVGRKLLHDTHWYLSIAPKVSYTQKGTKDSNATTAFLEFQNNTAAFTIPLPKANDSTNDTVWFEIVLDNGMTQKTIYTSPKNNTSNFPSADSNGLMIDAVYNGTIITGNAELAVTIKLPSCGF